MIKAAIFNLDKTSNNRAETHRSWFRIHISQKRRFISKDQKREFLLANRKSMLN